MSKYPTIVTMMYDIRKMENCKNERNRKLESYIDFSKKFMLTLPYPMIIFISPDDSYTKNTILSVRGDLELLDKTFIYELDFKYTYFYRHLSRVEELQRSFFILNGDIKHETPLYVILNNNKFCFIEQSIMLNPFKTSHFLWMDFGINHVALTTDHIHEWITQIPDKIKQLCINPYIEPVEPRQFFKNIHHNCAGGLFSGSAENMFKYCQLFKQKTEQIYNAGWYQIDEAVMTLVQLENLDMFEFFFGDYEGIVSNYLRPVHSTPLIHAVMNKCIVLNKPEWLYKILVFMEPYYLNMAKDNDVTETLMNYINNSVVCDYYYNNNELRQSLIETINVLIKSENDYIKEFIKNSQNLQYYKNKDLIMKF
jgi:hypothetical protein